MLHRQHCAPAVCSSSEKSEEGTAYGKFIGKRERNWQLNPHFTYTCHYRRNDMLKLRKTTGYFLKRCRSLCGWYEIEFCFLWSTDHSHKSSISESGDWYYKHVDAVLEVACKRYTEKGVEKDNCRKPGDLEAHSTRRAYIRSHGLVGGCQTTWGLHEEHFVVAELNRPGRSRIKRGLTTPANPIRVSGAHVIPSPTTETSTKARSLLFSPLHRSLLPGTGQSASRKYLLKCSFLLILNTAFPNPPIINPVLLCVWLWWWWLEFAETPMTY